MAIDVAASDVDEVSAELFGLGASGVEERDDKTLVRGAPGKVTLVGSFAGPEEAEAAIDALADRGEARLEIVVGDAWRDAWKEHFAPFSLTPRIKVVPPWIEYERAEGEDVLVLEPGRAFGTGLHASTSLVSEILDESRAELEGKEILDVGCGSGILSFVALLCGAARAIAIDIDPDVVEVVRENAARNGLEERVEARAATVDSIDSAYPWVVANIEARVLKPIAADLERVVAPGGRLVLSGILESEHDAIVSHYGSLSRRLRHLVTKKRGEAAGEAWVAIAFAALP